MRAQLTIKNYRCFVDPITIEIGSGFTAFVGINNAGKSSVMRCLLEFRRLFQLIASPTGNFINHLRGAQSFPLDHVTDHNEVFSNRNNNQIEISFEFTYDSRPSHLDPRRLLLIIARSPTHNSVAVILLMEERQNVI